MPHHFAWSRLRAESVKGGNSYPRFLDKLVGGVKSVEMTCKWEKSVRPSPRVVLCPLPWLAK